MQIDAIQVETKTLPDGLNSFNLCEKILLPSPGLRISQGFDLLLGF